MQTARPAWASVIPCAARGTRRKRSKLSVNATCPSLILDDHSRKVATRSHTAIAIDKTARAGPFVWIYQTTSAAIHAINITHLSRLITPAKSARFHDKNGPMPMIRTSGSMIGMKLALKKGGPTEILSPVRPSRNNG